MPQNDVILQADYFTLYKDENEGQTSPRDFSLENLDLSTGEILYNSLIINQKAGKLSLPILQQSTSHATLGNIHRPILISPSSLMLLWNGWHPSTFTNYVNIGLPVAEVSSESIPMVDVSEDGNIIAYTNHTSFFLCHLNILNNTLISYQWKQPGVQFDQFKVDNILWWNPSHHDPILLVLSNGNLYSYSSKSTPQQIIQDSLCLNKFECQTWQTLDDTLLSLTDGILRGYSLQIHMKSSGPVLVMDRRWKFDTHLTPLSTFQPFPFVDRDYYSTDELATEPIVAKQGDQLLLIRPTDTDPIIQLLHDKVDLYWTWPNTILKTMFGLDSNLILFSTKETLKNVTPEQGNGTICMGGWTGVSKVDRGKPLQFLAEPDFRPLSVSLSQSLILGLSTPSSSSLDRILMAPSMVEHGWDQVWHNVQHYQHLLEVYLVRWVETANQQDILKARHLVEVWTTQDLFLDLLVNVARKSESRYWPLLFNGLKPSELLTTSLSKGLLDTAVKYLVVTQNLDDLPLGILEKLVADVVKKKEWKVGRDLVRYLASISRGNKAESWMDLLDKKPRKRNSLLSLDPDRRLPNGQPLVEMEDILVKHAGEVWQQGDWKQVVDMIDMGFPFDEFLEGIPKDFQVYHGLKGQDGLIEKLRVYFDDEFWKIIWKTLDRDEQVGQVLGEFEDDWCDVMMAGDESDVEFMVKVINGLESTTTS